MSNLLSNMEDVSMQRSTNKGFYRANWNHSQTVIDIVKGLTGSPNASADMILKLRNSYFYIFISDSGKSLLSFEPVFGVIPWYLVHTFCDEAERGLKLKLFLLGAGLWMADNTNMEALMAVIPDNLRRYGIFLRSAMGMKRIGKELDATIYTIGIDRYDEMRSKLNKLEQKSEV